MMLASLSVTYFPSFISFLSLSFPSLLSALRPMLSCAYGTASACQRRAKTARRPTRRCSQRDQPTGIHTNRQQGRHGGRTHTRHDYRQELCAALPSWSLVRPPLESSCQPVQRPAPVHLAVDLTHPTNQGLATRASGVEHCNERVRTRVQSDVDRLFECASNPVRSIRLGRICSSRCSPHFRPFSKAQAGSTAPLERVPRMPTLPLLHLA